MTGRRLEKGFSLIEVMIALLLFTIVIAGAAPAFILNLKYNTFSENRSRAAEAAQVKLDELRFENPQDLPVAGTTPAEDVTVGDKVFQVTATYCAEAQYCTSINTRHIRIQVAYNGEQQYEVETVFTKLK